MRLDARARRPSPLRLTALVDVIFLLLLFYMLSSNFLRFAEVEITSDTAGVSREIPSLVVRLEDGGAVAVNGKRMAVGSLESALNRIDPPFGTTVAVFGGRGGTVQDMVEVSETLRRAGLAVLLIDR
jgi:biopolymer transport protein ExbD